MGFINKVTQINPVRPGATSVIKLGTGDKNAPTLDKLQLKLKSTAGVFDASKITAVRGFIGGREFWREDTGVVINKRAAYLGQYNLASEVVLDFTEPNAKSGIEQYLSALPLSLLPSLQFEVDVDGTADASMVLTASAHFRPPTNNPFIKKRRRITEQFSAGGPQTIHLPSGAQGGKLTRVWIHEGTPGNITAAQLRARNAIGIDDTRVAIENDQKRYGLTPQAGIFVLDFIRDGNLAGWFDTAPLSDVDLELTANAGDSYTIFLDYLDPIGRL